MRYPRILGTIVAILLFAGCATQPDYSQTQAPCCDVVSPLLQGFDAYANLRQQNMQDQATWAQVYGQPQPTPNWFPQRTQFQPSFQTRNPF